MHSSPNDPTASVGNWFAARTYQATRPQDWTPQANLYLDYRAHAAATGLKMRNVLGIRAFETELRAICRREPQRRLAARIPGGATHHEPFWPRVLRAPARIAA